MNKDKTTFKRGITRNGWYHTFWFVWSLVFAAYESYIILSGNGNWLNFVLLGVFLFLMVACSALWTFEKEVRKQEQQLVDMNPERFEIE